MPPRGPHREDDEARALGRVAGLGEDPLSWSIPLGTLCGVRLGLHAIFPIWVVAECAAAAPGQWEGVLRAFTTVMCYALVVLARELARAWWAARAGRDVHEIIAWPLGGFSTFGAAGARMQSLGEMGGLGFTALLIVPGAGFLLALGANANDLARGIVDPSHYLRSTKDPIEIVAFWMVHALVVLTAAHLALPMAPFDVSRAIDRRNGERRSPIDVAHRALRRGFFVAFALFTGAAVAGLERWMAVGVLGGLTTWIEYRRVMFLHRPLHRSPLMDDRATSASEPIESVAEDPSGVHPGSLPELDDVLAKITRSGLAALTREEREALEEATRQRRLERDSNPPTSRHEE